MFKHYWTEPQTEDGKSGGFSHHTNKRDAIKDAKACLEFFPIVYMRKILTVPSILWGHSNKRETQNEEMQMRSLEDQMSEMQQIGDLPLL